MSGRLTHKAYNRHGYPDNEKVYRDGSELVVRASDTIDGALLRGQRLQVQCCAPSARNLCKERLRRRGSDLEKAQDAMHKALCSWADAWGKAEANSATKLVLIESSGNADSSGAVATSRVWALLVKAVFSPKFQLWCEVGTKPEPVPDASPAALSFPVQVALVPSAGRVCPNLQAPSIMTSDEFALRLVEIGVGHRLAAWEMEYTLPDKPDLLHMVVAGRGPALALQPREGQPGARSRNDALLEVRALGQVNDSADHVVLRHRSARNRTREPTGRGRGRGKGAPSEELLPEAANHGDPQPDVEGQVGVDVLVSESLLDMDPEDAAEVVECLDADAGVIAEVPDETGVSVLGVASGELAQNAASVVGDRGEELERLVEVGGAPLDDAAVDSPAQLPAPRELPPPPSPVRGPSDLGYLTDMRLGRSIGRLTAVWKGSVAVKCYLHGSTCTLAMAEWKLPGLGDVRNWLASAEVPPAGADGAAKKRMATAHVADLRRLRDAAIWPGRTRQSLVDEAAALDGELGV